MIARHTLTYLGSRGVAAALNLASLAVFTRLAPAETFGFYLLILSWALVLYGATCQWPKFSFFALYDESRAAAQAGTLVRLLAGMIGLAGLAGAGAAALGLVEARVAFAIVSAVFGMMAFEGAVEIARTRLRVEAVSLSVVLRALLVMILGSAALVLTGDPVHLLLATALANLLASVPAAHAIASLLRGRGDMREARRLLAYGWPLVLSFGAAALAQSIDRLIIGASIGVSELGAYGAFADFLRQSFVVFGESVAFSMISIAKRDARAGGIAAAGPVLKDAARTLTLIAGFGAVFFLAFDDLIVSILLGPEYRAAALAVAPYLLVASILLMVRSYYFGQIIYFAPSSRLDAVASFALLASIGGLSLVLIPRYGAVGAAIAAAVGQGVACLVFVLGARRPIRMPVPLADIGLIAGAALACWAATAWIDAAPAAQGAIGLVLKLAILGIGFAAVTWRFNIAGIADLTTGRGKRTA